MISFILIAITTSNAQTRELELENMNDMYTFGQITVEEYQNMSKEWRELLSEFGGYPELPFDESLGIIKYELFKEYPNISKEIIYKRIKV